MPPITTTAKTMMMRFDPISGVTWMTGAASTPASARRPGAAGVGQHHHQRHVDAERLHQRRVLGAARR
jgi:hypothetical protein